MAPHVVFECLKRTVELVAEYMLLYLSAVQTTSQPLLTSDHLVSLLGILQQNMTSPSHHVSVLFWQLICLFFLILGILVFVLFKNQTVFVVPYMWLVCGSWHVFVVGGSCYFLQ